MHGWAGAGGGQAGAGGIHSGAGTWPSLVLCSVGQVALSLLCPICPLGEIEQTHKSQMTLIAEDGPRPRYASGLVRLS